MIFEIRQSNGEYKEYPYRYSVYLDDKEVWSDDYRDEVKPNEIFIHFTESLSETQITTDKVIEVLMEREEK